MVLNLGCKLNQEGKFCQKEEKKVEKKFLLK